MLVVLQEKNHQNLLNGVESFDKSSMKHAATAEKIVLPDIAGMLTNACILLLLFNLCMLQMFGFRTLLVIRLYMKEIKCIYNNAVSIIMLNSSTIRVLLCVAVIEQEKGQQKLISGIENFDTSKLKHAETCEKNPLPTKDIIDQEKSA